MGLISNQPGEWHTVGAGQRFSERVSKEWTSLGCGAVAEVALFRAVSLLLGISPAFESVLQQMFKEERREEERRVVHASPCLQPIAQGLAPRGPLLHPSLLRILCLSYKVEAQEAGGP